MKKQFLLFIMLWFTITACNYTGGNPGIPSNLTYSHTTLSGGNFVDEKYKNTILNSIYVPNATMNPVLGQYNNNVAADISSRRIFATTTHELAHASHWELGFTASDYASKKKATLAESWAMGVEWVITNHVYSNLAALYGLPWTSYERPDRATQTKPINYWLYYDSGSTVSNNRDDFYTPVFIDLMDVENQKVTRTPAPFTYFNSLPNTSTQVFSTCPEDVSSGFTLSYLESKLAINTTSWVGLKNTLINTNPTTSSASSIQYLFDIYEN